MANPLRGLGKVLGSLLHPNRAADVIRMAEADPALAARLMEAAEAQDFGKSLRTLVFDLQRGRAPARQVPAAPQPEVVTFAQRLTRNPDVQAQIQSNMDRLPPALAQRIQAGDPDAAMEAYSMIARADGELPATDPLANIAADDGAGMPAEFSAMTDDQHAAFVADQMRGAPARQMELPLGGENALPPRGLIPFGVRGPGVPAGGPTGMGTARDVSGGLIPAPLRGLPGDVNPSFDMSLDVLLRRLSGESQQAPQVLRISGPQAPLGLPAPQPVSPGLYSRTGLPPENIYDTTADTGTGLAVIGRGGRGVPVGGPAGGPRGMIVRPSAAAGGGDFARGMGAGLAAGAGGFLVGRGAYDMLSDGEDATVANDDPAVVSGGTEDLAAETSPPPTVEPTADEPDSPAPAKVAGLPRRPGPDTGFIETNSAYSLKPAQQRTLDALLDAGIEPSRAEAIARGQRSLTQAEEMAIIANGPARRQRDMDMMDQRRRARMGAY